MTAARGSGRQAIGKRQVRHVSFKNMRGSDQGEKMRKRTAGTKTKHRKATEVAD